MKLAKTIIENAKRVHKESGLTMEELGLRMGADGKAARQTVWQLFNKTPDPRLSTIEKLAHALGVEVRELL